ncbi:MAG: hypothetical protein WCQ96_05850 [Patescibacteria group bacterium]
MKAKTIDIRNHRSTVEVFADFCKENQNHNGRIFMLDTTSDSIPSASYIPSINDIWEICENITREQAKQIQHAIRRNCNFSKK